jgi:hypothetical protein
VNIALNNQSVLSGIILASFWYYCGVVMVIFLFICHFYLFISVLHTFSIWNITSGIRAPSSTENCGLIFFRVETYFDVFKLQRSVVTCINPQSRIHTWNKYKWYLSTHLLSTLVTPVGTPPSDSASDNTCIRINLDLLKPSIDKLIARLTAIVPPRTTLGKILSSTWVVE